MVKKGPGCWIWQGATDGRYGEARLNGKKQKTHRIAWTLVNGEIPEGMFALHRCDNPPCVNPDHLFLGTKKDNRADCLQKGRQARGEMNGSALLTADAVRAIRASSLPHRELARMFGVVRSAI